MLSAGIGGLWFRLSKSAMRLSEGSRCLGLSVEWGYRGLRVEGLTRHVAVRGRVKQKIHPLRVLRGGGGGG